MTGTSAEPELLSAVNDGLDPDKEPEWSKSAFLFLVSLIECLPYVGYKWGFLMKRFVSLALVFSMLALGCYNTYRIPTSQLETLQSPPEQGDSVTVTDEKGEQVVVKDDSRVFVESDGGKRYPITPFNFKLTESQLVASDRDYILARDGLKDGGEIELVSTWKWALGITGGVVLAGAIIGLIAWAATTSGGESGTP